MLEGGTLVVVPKSIMSQWAQELHDKVRASLMVLPGTGSALSGFTHPPALHTTPLQELPCQAPGCCSRSASMACFPCSGMQHHCHCHT